VTEFIKPNWHVILIHYPLALLIVGVLIELFSFMWRRSGFRAAGRWMILIGALAGIPTATSGIYAARDVMSESSWHELQWHELREEAPLTAEQWHLLERHMWINGSSTMLFAITVVAWLACSDRWRRKLHLVFLLMLLIGCGLITTGAWYGGEMVYREAIGVGDPAGYVAEPGESATRDWQQTIEYYVPPIQLHVLMGGWTAALALVTLGLSIRAISAGESHVNSARSGGIDDDIADALYARRGELPPERDPGLGAPPPHSRLIETSEHPLSDPPVREVPAPRFWLVTALLALLTMAGGWWIVNPTSPQFVQEYLSDPEHNRALAHSITGATIVVLTLILAMITRWGPRQKVLLSIFALLLILALAAQVWFGIAMLFDTTGGPLTGYNAAASA
jgi:uncharacterized membrane protein